MTDEELLAFVAEEYRRATEAPIVPEPADTEREIDPRHKLHGDGGRKA
jgi:hypothetical protein